jgi:hypothetical protein
MKIMGYEITVEIDGVESVIELDDTYPSIRDWKTATEFAMLLARDQHQNAVHIDFVQCGEYELEEYAKYDYIHEAPFKLM